LSLDEERDDEINGTGLLAIPQVDASADITNVVLEYFWNIESIGIVDKHTNVHHRSLCPEEFGSSTNHTVAHCAHDIDIQEASEQVAREENLMSVNDMVLMQTTLTDVSISETCETEQVRILFDSESHRSYISETLAKKLKLKCEGKQNLNVSTFASKRSQKIETKFTNLNIHLKNCEKKLITVYIVPLISGELQRKPFT